MGTGAFVVCTARVARESASLWLELLGCSIRTASRTMTASRTIHTMTLVRCLPRFGPDHAPRQISPASGQRRGRQRKLIDPTMVTVSMETVLPVPWLCDVTARPRRIGPLRLVRLTVDPGTAVQVDPSGDV